MFSNHLSLNISVFGPKLFHFSDKCQDTLLPASVNSESSRQVSVAFSASGSLMLSFVWGERKADPGGIKPHRDLSVTFRLSVGVEESFLQDMMLSWSQFSEKVDLEGAPTTALVDNEGFIYSSICLMKTLSLLECLDEGPHKYNVTPGRCCGRYPSSVCEQ